MRTFPDWDDPRGEVLGGVRLERACWWDSVTADGLPPSTLEAELPMTTTCRLDPGIVSAPRLREDSARIAPRGVSPLDRDIGLGTLHRADEPTVFGCSPWTFTGAWR